MGATPPKPEEAQQAAQQPAKKEGAAAAEKTRADDPAKYPSKESIGPFCALPPNCRSCNLQAALRLVHNIFPGSAPPAWHKTGLEVSQRGGGCPLQGAGLHAQSLRSKGAQ